MKEYSGFSRNFDDKQDASVFAKITLFIICYSLSVCTALTSSRSASGSPCDLESASRTCLSFPTYHISLS